MITQFSFFAIAGWKVFKKETDVYAAPMMEVIAAHKSTRPAKRYPISPAPARNASAAGLDDPDKSAPFATTPKTIATTLTTPGTRKQQI